MLRSAKVRYGVVVAALLPPLKGRVSASWRSR